MHNNNHSYKRNFSSFDGKRRNRKNFNDRIAENITFLCNARDILINKCPKFTHTPRNCCNYDKELIYAKDYWHEITVSKEKDKKCMKLT